jgi:hypothetical protein
VRTVPSMAARGVGPVSSRDCAGIGAWRWLCSWGSPETVGCVHQAAPLAASVAAGGGRGSCRVVEALAHRAHGKDGGRWCRDQAGRRRLTDECVVRKLFFLTMRLFGWSDFSRNALQIDLSPYPLPKIYDRWVQRER